VRPLDELPAVLRARADVAGSGELLWPCAATHDVVRIVADGGLAVLGGEVYEPRGEAIGCFRSEWMTRRRTDEPWCEYIERAAERTHDEITRAAEETGADLRYFLAICDERDYPTSLHFAGAAGETRRQESE
jgi:hypothetical protein